MLLRLNGMLESWCLRDTPGLHGDLDEIRGEAFSLFGRWLDEKEIDEGEPLMFLARALWKQSAEAFCRERGRELREVSTTQPLPTGEEGTPHWMERELSFARGFDDPEEALAAKEAAAWLRGARERLSPNDRETFDAEERLKEGEAKSLHEALGISEEAAWKRRQRMRQAIVELARRDGCEEILELARGARSKRRDAGPVKGRRKWIR